MFQDPSESYFVPNDVLAPQQYGIHSTPNSQCTESETSFDSGYLSPANSQSTPGQSGGRAFRGFQTLQNDKYMVPTIPGYQQSPAPKLYQSTVFDDDWDKKFIENFEANLFGIDPAEDFSSEDINLFSELLTSPLKSGLSPVRLYDTKNSPGKYSRSPMKLFFSPPKSLSSRKNILGVGSSGLSDFNSPCNTINKNEHITLTGLSDPNLNLISTSGFQETPKQSCILDQSLLSHNYAKPSKSCHVSGPKSHQTYQKTKGIQQAAPTVKSEPITEIENCTSPELLPSKQKLQYVRAKFKQTLQKAVENAHNAAVNEEKYPQLTKRLSNSNSMSTTLKENLPTTVNSQDTCTTSSQQLAEGSKKGESFKQRFRELAPAPSSKRTFACIVNNQYEVQQQSDCQIVIKKRKS
ncbi:hypothetical protein LOTGIDRAFT_164546 [Lottia gigantea]|uniref:Uncharacterized protein n=1 Tax=Lottia gigantea TaxID=225164 RepID=V4BLZ4_LOTGI|nr:hypothetical protein LOTGIDRAFT_164546 [Lottia gigantea]ESO89859.1 hypothetical protein LOTGIDRAFT_164546 [Lottia gigantea]